MKLLTFLRDRQQELGVLDDDSRIIPVRDLARSADCYLPSSMMELIDEAAHFIPCLHEALQSKAALACPRLSRSDVRILAPIPRPRKGIIGVGMNYKAHVDEAHVSMGTSQGLPKAPVYFTKPATSVIGPNDAILHHEEVTSQLDWEAELAVIIGRTGKAIRREDALDYVFGYTCLNDISARDCRREHQWFLAKSLDASAPMGPFIVTRDEIADPQALNLSLTVNGEVKQRDSTARMIFSVADIIADLSRAITLEPGDIIATGTPAGVGVSLVPPQFLRDGDEVVMEVEQVGVLRNVVRRA